MGDATPDPATAALEAIRALSAGYLASLPGKVDDIERAWAQLAGFGWDVEAARDLHRAIHSVSGSARVFGLPAVGEAARRVEHLLAPLLERAERPDDEAVATVTLGIREFRNTSASAT